MNDFYIFAGIVLGMVAIIIPSLLYGFRNSIIGIIGTVIIALCGLVALIAYYLATAGLRPLIWITPVTLGVILAFLYLLRMRLTLPLNELTDIIVAQLAKGKLDFTFSQKLSKRNDELGKVTRSLEEMRLQISSIMSDLHVLSTLLASSAKGQDSTAIEVSKDASQQAASVEEISSTIEEIAANIESNASNAIETEEISSIAQQGISDVVEKAKASLEASRAIREKIKIINDIAFQTNILALNAAVEAARAGQHGKGFAVVAAEVRKLSDLSRQAAEDIVELADTNLDLAETAGEHMQKLIPDIQKTSQLVKEIASASQEQNHGASQVSEAIQQLNSITQQNASSSQKMAKNSKELNSQADQLRKIISFFELGDKADKVLNEQKHTASGLEKVEQDSNEKF